VTLNGNGSYVYAPAANYNGPDSFTYRAGDGTSQSAVRTVAIAVTPADDAPTAQNDALTIAQGAARTSIDVLANDTDIDGGTKLVEAVTQPAGGSAAPAGDGSVVLYKPDAGYCNTQPGGSADTFAYRVNGAAQATVAVTVTCAAPAAPNEPAADAVSPVFASASLTNKTFAISTTGPAETPVAARARRGTTFLYALSEASRVVFTIEARRVGRRSGTTCQKPASSNRGGRSCTLWVRVGGFAQDGVAGSNRKAFSGKIGRRTLAPGRYRATLLATDAAGNESAARRLSLTVVKR
jgi:hypothetical protein